MSIHNRKRIGLLTPYTGGNLGDGAIQEAAIQNIRARQPDADIIGITLYPEETARRHRIPCFPLTSFSTPFYGPGPASIQSAGGSQKREWEEAKLSARLKGMMRTSAPVYRPLKLVYRALKFVLTEIRHISSSYRISKGLSLLLVSGGGQLDDYWGGPWGHPYALFKWGSMARLGRTPFVVLSVGTCTFDSKLSKFFIRRALAMASYRSYRDETSKTLLAEMAFTGKDRVYPDLAFSYRGSGHGRSRKRGGLRAVVGISPIAYLHPRRWPKADPATYDNYARQLVQFVSLLVQQGYSVTFFWTDGSDRHIIDEMINTLNKQVAPALRRRITRASAFDLDGLWTNISDVDWIIASRLHGVLLSHLASKPVLAISYDRKVNAHMEDMGQSDYCVDIHNLDAGVLLDKFHSLRMNSHYIRSTIGKKVAERRSRLEMQYDVVLGTRSISLLSSSAG